mmetsp:Transcript_699/g.679  ORF Transcript_699/g.679 Transcript_699/m.679 type:complete len:109 (-) Transcript_699:6-332(-)
MESLQQDFDNNSGLKNSSVKLSTFEILNRKYKQYSNLAKDGYIYQFKKKSGSGGKNFIYECINKRKTRCNVQLLVNFDFTVENLTPHAIHNHKASYSHVCSAEEHAQG